MEERKKLENVVSVTAHFEQGILKITKLAMTERGKCV